MYGSATVPGIIGTLQTCSSASKPGTVLRSLKSKLSETCYVNDIQNFFLSLTVAKSI